MSYAILDPETGEVMQGGLSALEVERIRENCPLPDDLVIEDETEESE